LALRPAGAAFPASPNPASHEYPVTQIAEVVGEYAEFTPCLGGDLDVRLDSGPSVKARALHSPAQGGEQLDVLGRVRRKRLDIAAIEGVSTSPGDLHVLLRNNRSPRLQRWFERNALTESFELSH